MGTYKPLHHLNSGALSARDHTDMGRWHVTSAMFPGNRTKDGFPKPELQKSLHLCTQFQWAAFLCNPCIQLQCEVLCHSPALYVESRQFGWGDAGGIKHWDWI